MVSKPQYMLVDARSGLMSKRLGTLGWVAWDWIHDEQAGPVTSFESADDRVDELNAQAWQ